MLAGLLDTRFSIYSLKQLAQCNKKVQETMTGREKVDYKLQNQDDKTPELTVEMFFEFMRTAYQVNDSFDQLSAVLSANSEIDWTELAKINLNNRSTNEKSTEIDNNNKDDDDDDDGGCEMKNENDEIDDKEDTLSKLLKTNLSDILHEGLLDSVLPYMLPKPATSQPVIKKPMTSLEPKKTSSLTLSLEKSLAAAATTIKLKDNNKEQGKINRKSLENEVEIHVCDEAKNVKKDFRCPQKLLIEKMCYFGDVTAGQKLEEMDISVHCDIVIFDWLMRWVKKDIIKKCEWPVLEASNVIPITVSASFLQMEPLLEQCLIFCHENMSEVLKTSTILTCLNDNIFTRLANLFTNIDVESLKDKKDKIQSRLFCKLIASLADPLPDNKRGHYSSLSTLFKCGKCYKYIISFVSDTVPCISASMKIDNKGNVYSKHTRDLSWSLNNYIINLKCELKSWRKVYWRLWGDCHFLQCRQCNISFPINQMDWCAHHLDSPQFFINQHQRGTSFPLGRYPCCSQRAYRFEALINREGCRHREHIPKITADYDGHVLNIFSMYRDVVSLNPTLKFYPDKITRLATRDSSSSKLQCREAMWWNGIELAPARSKLGLLAKLWAGPSVKKTCAGYTGKNKLPGENRDSQSSSDSDLNNNVNHDVENNNNNNNNNEADDDNDDDDEEDVVVVEHGTGIMSGDSSIGDEDSDNSEESNAWPARHFKTTKIKQTCLAFPKRNDQVRNWSMNVVVRYNQDNQRDFEERAAAQMIALLTKTTAIETRVNQKIYNNNNNHSYHHHYYHYHHHHHHHHGQGWTSQPIGGTYTKLEAEFREQSCQLSKNKNSSHPKSLIRAKSSKA